MEKWLEVAVDAQVVLNDERAVQPVVDDVLHGQEVLVGTAGPWEPAVHGVLSAIVGEITVKDFWCQVLYVAVEDIMTGKPQRVELLLDELSAVFVSLYMNDKYRDIRHEWSSFVFVGRKITKNMCNIKIN
jgi:hypothetical protein